MDAFDVLRWLREVARTFRLAVVVTALAFLGPAWLLLTSLEWSEQAIWRVDSTGFPGLALASTAALSLLLAATVRKLAHRIAARQRQGRIQSARRAAVARNEAKLAERIARFQNLEGQERMVLATFVHAGSKTLKFRTMARILNLDQKEVGKLSQGVLRLEQRGFLVGLENTSQARFRLKDDLFQFLSENPAAVLDTAPPRPMAREILR